MSLSGLSLNCGCVGVKIIKLLPMIFWYFWPCRAMNIKLFSHEKWEVVQKNWKTLVRLFERVDPHPPTFSQLFVIFVSKVVMFGVVLPFH